MSDELLLRSLRIGWHDDDTPIWVSDAMTEAADRIEALTAELSACTESPGGCGYWRERSKALTAERDRLREAIDYILDGMGIADPDYDPDDDFLDAANSWWVRDTLTRLAAALKGESHE